MGKDVRS